MSDDDIVDLGNSEGFDLGIPHSAEEYRRAAGKLRAKAAATPDLRFGRFAQPETKPTPPSLDSLVGYPRIDADFEADDSARRTARAHFEIMRAVELEKQEAEQQRQRARADARAKVRQTALGRLLGD
jgi:hypothetical protein